MDTGVYVSPALTQCQLIELQVRVQTLKTEKQQADAKVQAVEAENRQLQLSLQTETQI